MGQLGLCLSLYEQKGSAGVLAVIMSALLLLVGGGYLAIAKTERATAASYRDGIAAQYLAEAGLQDAVAQLKADTAGTGIRDASKSATGTPSVVSGIINSGPTSGTYSWTVKKSAADTDRTRTVTSVGAVGSSKRTIIATVTLGGGVFSYMAYGGGDMSADNNANIKGDIGSNKTVFVKNNANIDGNVSAHETISTQNNSHITGTQTEGADSITIPTFSGSNYASAETLAGGTTWSAGVYKVMGDLTLANNTQISVTGDVTIYVAGKVTVNNNSLVNMAGTAVANPAGRLVILAEDTITIENNAYLGNVLLLAKKNIAISNNAGVLGGVYSVNGIVKFDNNAHGTFDSGFLQGVLGVAQNKGIADAAGANATGAFGVANYRNRL